MNGVVLLSSGFLVPEKREVREGTPRSFGMIFVASVALAALISLVLMGSNGTFTSYVLAVGSGVFASLLVKYEKVPVLGLGIVGFCYNLFPQIDGLTYILSYIPIAFLVIRRRPRQGIAYALWLLLGSIGNLFISGGSEPALLMVTCILIVFAWVIGTMIRGYDDKILLKEAEADMASALAKLEAAEFAKEISREMHDAVAHSMSSVVLKARVAALKEGLDAESKKELEEITELATQSLGEMRSLLRLLRGSDDESGRYRKYLVIDPIVEAHRIEEFLRGQDYSVRMVVEGEFSDADPLSISTFVSCIREAGANVIRHGSDKHPVIITVNADQEQISLAFINTVDPERHSIFPSSGLGLIGVRERIEAVGGSMVSQQAGEKWILNFSVPKRIGETQERELSYAE